MIHLLRGDAFSGVLSAPKAIGLSPIFRAKVKIRKEDDPIRCYVKPQPDRIPCHITQGKTENREIINEVLGYTLAHSCGFSVPDSAGVILLDRDQLPENVLEQLEGMYGSHQENYLCWFSEDMSHPNLMQKFNGTGSPYLQALQLNRLIKHLANSNDTPRVVAFDEWLKNTDRHPGNLLSGSGDSYTLIDHGRILLYPNWSPGTLGIMPPNIPCENRLKELLDKHIDSWSRKLPNSNAMLLAYKSFLVSFREGGEDAVRAALTDMLESEEIDSVIGLLHTMHTPASYAKASGILSL